MAHGIYGTVFPTCLRLYLPGPPPLSSGFHFLFSQTQASSHKRTTNAIPLCSYPSTLVIVRVSYSVFSGIVNISVLMLVNTYWKAALATSKPGLIR
jgi:hypothetical protein